MHIHRNNSSTCQPRSCLGATRQHEAQRPVCVQSAQHQLHDCHLQHEVHGHEVHSGGLSQEGGDHRGNRCVVWQPTTQEWLLVRPKKSFRTSRPLSLQPMPCPLPTPPSLRPSWGKARAHNSNKQGSPPRSVSRGLAATLFLLTSACGRCVVSVVIGAATTEYAAENIAEVSAHGGRGEKG